MQLNTHVDVELVAVQQPDELSILLELTAPEARATEPRRPAAVEVVLDRSGSMAGERLEAALAGLIALVDRLDPHDRFGVVAFDDTAQVVVPAGPVADKHGTKQAIAAIGPGGMTNLSGGLLRGVQEARRAADQAGATLLLLSDGHANAGETGADRLASVAAAAKRHGVTTTTVGIGLGYDETLLAAVARGGQGNHVFAEEADAAAAAVSGEVSGLLSRTAQAVSLLIRPTADVASVTVFNDLPGHAVDGGVMLELGDLWAGERRKLLLGLDVPASPALGLTQVATLELRYVALPDLVEQTVTLPVSVNVVPGDQAAGRVPDPRVRSELLFQRAQQAKREAADAIADGDEPRAMQALAAAAAQLAGSDEDERSVVLDMAADIDRGQAVRAAKRALADHHHKSRKRGRRM